jgi:hypothetical protein
MQKLSAIRMAVVAAVCTAAALTPRAWGDLAVPQFSSLPIPLNGNTRTLYLDFDGDFTDSFGPYSNITTPAYSIDADLLNFSTTEQENIRKIWSGVAEKYSPFNLNVTTIDPGNRDAGATMAVDIGGKGEWLGTPAGGIASIHGFNEGYTTAFVFPGWLGNGHPKYVTEASAHESGHAFGLNHQSTYSPTGGKLQEYSDNGGSTERAPIMGLSYYVKRGQWWKGTPSTSRFAIQDDMSVLAQTGFLNNFGYRPDDYPGPAILSVASDLALSAHGVIEKTTDMDALTFHTPGGVASIFANVNPDTPMLDLSLSIIDGDGNIVGSAATASLGEFLLLPLDEGDYTVQISSAQNYGDVGQWFLSGFVAPEPASLALVGLGLLAALRRRR